MASAIHSDDGDFGFQIAPMIDVVFVLMLFFVTCAVFEPTELTLDAAMPKPSHGHSNLVAVDVTIADSGEVYLQGKLVAAADDQAITSLSTWLRNSRDRFGGRDPLVISPAPTVKHDRVMKVLEAVSAAGWKNVTFR